MANVQRAGWIGRNKFNLYFFTLADFTGAEAVATFENGADDVERGLLVNEKVDKSRPGNLDLVYMLIIGQGIDQGLRQVTRIFASRLGQHHCNIAGKVAMGNIGCTRYLDIRLQSSIQYTLLL